ncbi:hypothetical protein B0H14DRAFT_3136730 [Mycena olivaceomarginata]|nr:hypothetical protein B0H14DRAFT_3136730 [Mycena olivaceomarginata]
MLNVNLRPHAFGIVPTRYIISATRNIQRHCQIPSSFAVQTTMVWAITQVGGSTLSLEPTPEAVSLINETLEKMDNMRPRNIGRMHWQDRVGAVGQVILYLLAIQYELGEVFDLSGQTLLDILNGSISPPKFERLNPSRNTGMTSISITVTDAADAEFHGKRKGNNEQAESLRPAKRNRKMENGGRGGGGHEKDKRQRTKVPRLIRQGERRSRRLAQIS